MPNHKHTPSTGIVVDSTSSAIIDGVRTITAAAPIIGGSFSISCPNCGSFIVKIHRTRILAGEIVESDIECFSCGKRHVSWRR